MKTKIGFNLRQVCGENIIVAEGEENIDFSNIISMNESSAFLWKEAQQLESFTIADLVRILTAEYEVDEATASDAGHSSFCVGTIGEATEGSFVLTASLLVYVDGAIAAGETNEGREGEAP